MSQSGQDRSRQGRSDDAQRRTSNGPRERPLERIDGCTRSPQLLQVEGHPPGTSVRQWLLDRETYEMDLRVVCMRRNLEFMLIRKLRGDPKELYEAALETELLKIINEPKNGVEADIPLLFHGIHMDMKEDDVLSRKPELRKKIFKRLLEVMDPDPVRDACVLDMEKAWHPVEFTWESISELVIHHAQEQQRFYSTYSAGRKKPGYEAKAAKNKKENRKGDYSRQEQRDCGDAAHLYDKCPSASAEDRAKIKYEWALVAKRMQNGKALKLKAKKLRDSLMTANKKWREEQGQSRLDETVHTTHLPTVLVGSAVGNLPVTAKKTVELRTTLSAAAEQVKLPGKQLFYVVDNNDELIVRKYALISIGLDMDRLLEQVAVRQIHEDGDNIGDPGADEDIAFGVSVRGLRANDKQLDVEDMRAAENLYKVATTSANAADQAQAATFKQLQGIVVDAATKAVWGTKFRGTDLPANVKAMELRLKTGARPYRCKPRKVNPLTGMFVKAFGKQLEQDQVIYANSSSSHPIPVNLPNDPTMPLQLLVLENIRDAKIDDILEWANTFDEYVSVMRAVFDVCMKFRLRLTPRKSKQLCSEIKWCGRIINGDGVRSDPTRIQALCHIPYRTDAGQLQQFICAVN
ncbi:hypothetical protein H257_09094 [Aphanomyces astaci]|uniref:Reverse transcriptase domain-containing protein n=1 Tax=Aphanomyces astaci TaxID=112090 RepID=W4GBZ7_APHAT|nr:hypothetical protein H257_09094 [Aphanomyces astaci]ETV77207.1 hypothetical protein H257_09094 [Aphanomyces astaci]|eukprot:XP_009833513.1 hypothetical protein H257_09094 [Aphanomyces astaci]